MGPAAIGPEVLHVETIGRAKSNSYRVEPRAIARSIASRAVSLMRCPCLAARSPSAVRRVSSSRIVSGRPRSPPARRLRPAPAPGHPVPRASDGSTSRSARRCPTYGVRCAHPPEIAGQWTMAPCSSVPTQRPGSCGQEYSVAAGDWIGVSAGWLRLSCCNGAGRDPLSLARGRRRCLATTASPGVVGPNGDVLDDE